MTYTEIATYAFAALGFVATLANAASLAVPAGSTLGRWLAWIASMPIKALPPDAKQKARVAAEMAKTMGPPLLLIAALGSLTLLNGCAGTLEETRGQLRVERLLGVRQAAARDEAYCRSLSSKERLWTAVSITGATLSGASGLTTIPVESKRGDQILAAGVAVSAVGAVVGLALEQSYSREWQRVGCGE